MKKDAPADGSADGASSPTAREKFKPPQRPTGSQAGGSKAANAPAAKAKAEPSAKALPRGQKAKAKKMKEKYGDQDEDERMLRLALLGSKETKRFVAQPTAADDEEDAEGDAAAAAPPASAGTSGDASSAQQPAKSGGSAGGPGAASGTASEQGGKRGPNPDKRPNPRKDQDVRLTAGCDAEDRSPQETQLAQLDVLTGQPAGEDEVLYAMPMVAPYCSLGGPYTFRAKLTPGPGKKGQVMKQCLKMFETQMDRQAMKLLVQAIPENEATCLMMGTCKASMPGMQKLQQQVRKENKKDKKERDGGGASAKK